MSKFKVGDRIHNTNAFVPGHNGGKNGEVVAINSLCNGVTEIVIKYDDGAEGRCREGGIYYKKINSITLMKKLSNFVTKCVDADTQALLKAGYINGDLEPTEKAFDKIDEINFFANRAALVVAANEEIAAEEAEAKKNG